MQQNREKLPEIIVFAGPNGSGKSTIPYRIFKKRKTEYFIWDNEIWDEKTIRKLVGFELWICGYLGRHKPFGFKDSDGFICFLPNI